MPMMFRCRVSVVAVMALFINCMSGMMVEGQNQNNGTYFLDRFSFKDETIVRDDGFMDYTPSEWQNIVCDETDSLDECLAYRDKWRTGRGWSVKKNYCRWCPEGEGLCGRHHQSPIDLRRSFGLDPFPWEENFHPDANECIDIHWMKYEDSSCSMEELIAEDAFTIERHGLRISQPITVYEDFANDTDGLVDGVRLRCRKEGLGARFGRIDFSKGFSQWWHLSHTDIRTPSEHTQEGFRYDAEIQLHHFYSVTKEQTGTETANQLATVSVFMQAYPNAAPYPYLDKVICQWRRREAKIRDQCGLWPVTTPYPSCFPLTRSEGRRLKEEDQAGNIRGSFNNQQQSETNREQHTDGRKRFKTVEEVIHYNDQHRGDSDHKDVRIEMDPANFGPAEDKDWDAWIKEQSDTMNKDEELYHKIRHNDYGGDHSEDLHENFRRLIQGDNLEWFNYWPMLGVRTEYYYRYSGSQTIPPCYGNFQEDTRAETNHWRVMKDPIRIHPRQLVELRRLVADRIAPIDDPVNPCQPDTAAIVTRDPETNKVLDVQAARPLQDFSDQHFKTFCECKDWPSKWPEDREWCLMEDIRERFYVHPYNFDSDAFESPEGFEFIEVEPFNNKEDNKDNKDNKDKDKNKL
mmetsp:Transcript_57646/g.140799  ORF Transcript_57646/g.140799 Transcript_57646/m.140799 type:complete len:631 (+) Transcript_57646:68-1960(+)